MTNLSAIHQELRSLIAGDATDWETLKEHLLTHSNLPGPRANLELAAAFADCFASGEVTAHQFDRLCHWAGLTPAEAPRGESGEFLPLAAVLALGALYGAAGDSRRAVILDTLRRAANDERWRVREGAAIALQRMGGHDFAGLRAVFDQWLPAANLLEWRCVLATLAHPPLLRDPEAVHYCLDTADAALTLLAGLEPGVRHTEPYRVVRQALEYALSVFVSALPEAGFAHLKPWAESSDHDGRRIVQANLKNSRLAKRHPERVDAVQTQLNSGA